MTDLSITVVWCPLGLSQILFRCAETMIRKKHYEIEHQNLAVFIKIHIFNPNFGQLSPTPYYHKKITLKPFFIDNFFVYQIKCL